jgi:ABC-type uncharacterized transport system YnjBCD permease subunit
MVMLKTFAVTILAAAFVTLAIALGPNTPDALATARAMIVTNDNVKLNEPTAEQSCAVFEVWFLNPTCSQTQHAKKAARIKHRQAQRS